MSGRSRTAVALADRLEELAAVLDHLDDATYARTREDGRSGSVGAHVRHTIDHVAALVDRSRPGLVDYDSRRRGTEVERRRPAATGELRRLRTVLATWLPAVEQIEVGISADIDGSGARVAVSSTVGRELVFVLSHTIHHQAIIALLLASAGEEAPERFGVAPSTPSRFPCVRSA